jgi:hypothetical protein
VLHQIRLKGCKDSAWRAADADAALAVALTSTAFKPGDKIPSKYACAGARAELMATHQKGDP